MSASKLIVESSPLLIIKQAIKDSEQHALATYHKGAKAQFNLSAAFTIAKVVKLSNYVETANQTWKTNGKFDPKKFNHLEMSPADPDGIRRGPNGKPITPEDDEQVVVGMSNITDASHFAQAQNIFHLHLTSIFETPNSNDSDSPSDILKASRFLGRIMSVYYNRINLEANRKEQGIRTSLLTAYTSGSASDQRKFGELIRTCRDDNALLDDAGKRIADKVFKDLLLDGLRAGYKHLSTADPALHYHLQEACRDSTSDAVSIGQAITNFSCGYAKAALDNGQGSDQSYTQETLQHALQADIASPMDTYRREKGRGEPNRGPRREVIKTHNGYNKKASEYLGKSKEDLIHMLLTSMHQISNLDHQLAQLRTAKQKIYRDLQIAKELAVSKVGSVHEVESAMFAGKPSMTRAKVQGPPKVQKPPKQHHRITMHSDNDSDDNNSDGEFAGVALAFETDQDSHPPIVPAVAMSIKGQPPAVQLITVPKSVPQAVKRPKKVKSAVRIHNISTTKKSRTPVPNLPIKLKLMEESWESVDSQESMDAVGEAAFLGYDSDEEVQAPRHMIPSIDSGTSLHLALATQAIMSNNDGSSERAMLAVAQYVRDQAAQGNFEYCDATICNGSIIDRGYLLDILNTYDPEDQDEDSESCDETSSSGRE